MTLVGLSSTDDLAAWRFAREQGFVVVTKDHDFLDLAALHGSPPIVIRLVLGNSSNQRVLAALLAHREAIESAAARRDTAVIEVG